MTDDLKEFLGKIHTFLDRNKDSDPEQAELLAELEPILFNEIMKALKP